MNVHRKIGLALGGGGARALAHIGVLKVLEREGIRVDFVAGTSMGGLVAACFAAGMDAASMEREALRMARRRNLVPLVDRSLPGLGLLKGERLRDYFRSLLGDTTFDQLRLSLALLAVDLLTGEEVALCDGLVIDAVRATTALPGFLQPYPLGGRLLVDGGVLNNVPADVVRAMGADVVIAVNVSANAELPPYEVPEDSGRLSALQVLHIMAPVRRAVDIVSHRIMVYRLAQAEPDLVLCPRLDLGITALGGFPHATAILAAGEAIAEEALPRLREVVAGP